MIFLVVLVLLVLAAGNRVLGRSWLYPPAAYCLLWAGLLAGVGAFRGVFDAVSLKTLLIYTVAAGCFSVGGGLAMLRGPTKSARVPTAEEKGVQEAVLLALVALFVALLPFYYRHLSFLSAASGVPDFWRGLRLQLVWSVSTGDVGLGAFAYYLSCATILTLVAAGGSPWPKTGRLVFPLVAILTMVALSMTATRLGMLLLVFGLLAVLWYRDEGVRPHYVALLAACLIVSFAGAALLLEKGADTTAGFKENLLTIADQFRLYVFGGVVAFDKIVRDPPLGQGPYLTLRAFYAVARALGASTPVPELVQPPVLVPEATNVYTIYYSYFIDFGTPGICVIMAGLGYLTTLVHRLAVAGSQPARILAALAFGYLVLSNSGEGFLISLSFWAQAGIFLWVFYSAPRVYRALRRAVPGASRGLGQPESVGEVER